MEISRDPTTDSPPPGEDFPRLELARLVGQAQEQAQNQAKRRYGLSVLLLALGLSQLALGFPTERYFGSMDSQWQLSGAGPPPQGILTLPIYALRSLGMSLEQAVFLVNSLLFGACAWALMRLLAQVGFGRPVILAATLTTLLSPIAWLGATLPTDFAAGTLGATLLATELFRTKQTKAFGYQWRVASSLALAYLLHAQNLWLLVPATIAVHHQAPNRDQGLLRAMGLVSVLGVCIGASVAALPDALGALRMAAFGEGMGSNTWAEHLGFWLFGLGALWYGLYSLVAGRREPEESPPPFWCLVWLAVGVFPFWYGGAAFGPQGGFLLPLAAVGLADALQRRVASQNLLKAGVALLMAQLLLVTASRIVLERGDPLRAWQASAQSQLQPGDVFLTASKNHAYITAFRFGLTTYWVDASGELNLSWQAPKTSGNRLVLDAWDTQAVPQTLLRPEQLLQAAPLSEEALRNPTVLGRHGFESKLP